MNLITHNIHSKIHKSSFSPVEISRMDSDYSYLLKGFTDYISRKTLTDVSAGPIKYLNEDTGFLITVAAGTPLLLPGWGPTSAPNRTEMLSGNKTTDPSEWALINATRSTGETIGAFTGGIITDTGAVFDRSQFFTSVNDGNPSGKQQFVILYRLGTGGGRIVFFDATAVTTSSITWDGSEWSAVTSVAGTAEVIADIPCECGFRALLVSMDWLNPANTITGAIGPNTSDGSNVELFGANAYEADHSMFPLFADAPGDITTRAGTTSQEEISDLPKLLGALDGFVEGTDLITDASTFFASVPIGWTNNGDGTYACDGTQPSTANLTSDSVLTVDQKFENVLEIISISAGTLKVFMGFGAGGSPISSTGVHTQRIPQSGVSLAVTYQASVDFVGTVRPISIKKVAPASCVIEGPLKIGFDPTDKGTSSTVFKINSTTDLRVSAAGNWTFGHNGLWSDTGFAPDPRIKYITRVVFGDYDGTQSFQCQIQDTDGTWYGGTIQSAEDHWTPGDDSMVWGDSNSWMTGYDPTSKPNNGGYWI